MQLQQRRPGLLLLLVLLLLVVAQAIEIKWTPADGEGPAPASKKYRDAMAAQHQQQQQGRGGMSEEEQIQRMMMEQHQQQQMQQQQRQRPPPPPSFVERLLLAGYMTIGGACGMAQRHPKAAATLAATAVTGLCLRRAARTNGLLLTRRPGLMTALEPPVAFLARLLEEELPGLVEKEEWAESGADEAGEEGVFLSRRVQVVGKGEGAYRKAAVLVRTMSLLDALATAEEGQPSLGRLFSSERMQEAVLVRKRPGGGWSVAPVAVRRRGGKQLAATGGKKKKKSKKGKGKKIEEVYEEMVLRALPGCAWGRGAELRLVAKWRDPTTGGDDVVTVEAVWYAPTAQKGRQGGASEAYLDRVTRKARELVEREMAVLRVRERQQRQLAEVGGLCDCLGWIGLGRHAG